MTNNQLAENSVIQLLNSVKLARDNAERADNRVDHSFYYALTIALEELQERRKTGSEPYGFTDGDRRGMIYKPEYADRLNEPLPVYRHAQPAPVVPDDYQRLRELYHAQEKRLFKIAQRIKGPAFDKYSHSPSQAIDVLEGAIFGEDGACRAAMLAAAPQEVKGEQGRTA